MSTKNASRKHGFSLVELVIVVVIIGVIAAIAVPRISRGAKGATEASVRGSLAGLRNSIDMYAAEHAGAFPGADGVEQTLIDQLILKTDRSGNVGTTAGVHIFGPYLRTGFPPLQVGPNTNPTGVSLANTGPISDDTQAAIGWVYNYVTGDIIANSSQADEAGTVYDTY